MNLIPTSARFIATAAMFIAVTTGSMPLTDSVAARAGPASPDPELQTIDLLSPVGAARTEAGSARPQPGAARTEAGSARPQPGTARTEAGSARPETASAAASRATRPFSLVGATWTDPAVALAGTVEVRTRTAAGGRWTAWQALGSDEPNAAGAGTEPGPVRGSTDPLWAGESNGIEARVTTPGALTGPLPAGLRLDLINPDKLGPTGPDKLGPTGPDKLGPTNPDGTAGAAPERATQEPAPGVTVPLRPVPAMIKRSGWNADEAIVQDPPEYTSDVQVMFVHHTATSNDYTCAQSASIVRGIELYHVRSRGWNDIGYNFLVDKCGTLFEGRRGGANRPVLGAHTLGFNAHSSAISVIGNYRAVNAPARVLRVIAQVAAYKVGEYGNNPYGRVVLTSSGGNRYQAGTGVTLNRISGHRDAGRTECPGNALYAQLGSIRARAGAGPAGLRYLRMTGSVRVGSQFFTQGVIRPLWDLTTPSALVGRFDVLVDGALVASLPSTNRTTALLLPTGTHIVGIRAVHLSGRSSTIAAQVVAETAPPV